MQELEKILEKIKEIKDGNRKEKLYAKYPPNSKNQEILNSYSQGYEDGTDNFYNVMAEIIRKHMNDGWIPVEKALPEYGKKVLAYGKSGKIDIASLYSRDKHMWLVGSMCSVAFDIIAWRTLPEPYRPEKGVEV